MNRIASIIVMVAAAVAGGAVMVVEVTGAHVLAPGFGTGLNAWSAMITVALGSLAIGYALGGWAADRFRAAAAALMAATLGAAGAACVGAGLTWDRVVDATAPWGANLGALAAAGALFGLTFLLLGAAYPLAVRLRTRDAAHVGRGSGGVSAVSAVGSLAGAAMAGFVLVPSLAIETILFGCGALLGISAGAILLTPRRSIPVAAILLLLSAGATVLPARALPDGTLLRRGSMYGPIEVVDRGIVRCLLVGGTCQGIGRGEPVEPAMDHVDAIAGMLAESLDPSDEVLCVGLGAGFLPRRLDPIRCRSVEIDPAIVETAERFFDFDRSRHSVVVADGRILMRSERRTYGAIVLDAFHGRDIPHHLLTRECFALARDRLAAGGLLVVNYEGLPGEDDPLLHAVEKTLRAVFETVEIRVSRKSPETGGVILVAGDADAWIDWPAGSTYRPHGTFLDDRPAVVLTDSRNPAELHLARQASCARKREE